MDIDRRAVWLTAAIVLCTLATQVEGQRGGRPAPRPPHPRPIEARPFEPGRETPGTLREDPFVGKLRERLSPNDPRVEVVRPTDTNDLPSMRRAAALEARVQKLEGELRDAQSSGARYRQAASETSLIALGYGAVAIGSVSVARQDAVRAFQAAEGLRVDGMVGPQTASALEAATVRAQRLALLDAQSDVKPLTLESHVDRQSPALYVLFGRDGVLYRGNDASELRVALSAQVGTGAPPVYVDASRYPSDRLSALRATLQISDAAQGRLSLKIGLVDSVGGLELLFRGVRIERIRDVEERSGGYGVDVDLARIQNYGAPPSRGGVVQPMVMRVWAATRQLVVDFMQTLQGMFSNANGHSVYPGTLADAVHAARVELARRHGLTEEELAKSLRVEFGTVEMVLRAQERDAVGE